MYTYKFNERERFSTKSIRYVDSFSPLTIIKIDIRWSIWKIRESSRCGTWLNSSWSLANQPTNQPLSAICWIVLLSVWDDMYIWLIKMGLGNEHRVTGEKREKNQKTQTGHLSSQLRHFMCHNVSSAYPSLIMSDRRPMWKKTENTCTSRITYRWTHSSLIWVGKIAVILYRY